MRRFPVSGKVPAIEGDWKQEAVENAETKWPYHKGLWGIVTGDGFFVIDIDVKSGGLDTLKGLNLPDTYQVRTAGGGLHLYYKTDKPIRNKVGWLPGVDVRGVGGYVVGYKETNSTPITSAPAWLENALIGQINKPERHISKGSSEAFISEGGRNHYLTTVAGKLQRLGVLTLEGLKGVNHRDCNPPLDDQEVLTIFNSVSRYEPEAPIEVKKMLWASDFITPMMDYLNDKGLVNGEPTGISGIDEMLGGGKRLGELTVTLAEAKTGKNTLWHKFMYLWLSRGIPVGYASRELSPETEVLPNLLTLAFKKNFYTMKEYNLEEITKVISSWRLAFTDGYGSIDEVELTGWMDELRLAGVQYFWIDHLHYCLEDPEDFKGISKLIRVLKAYAKTHSVHIDLIVQPKLQEQGMRLSLNSLRGGAAIGQALDNLITMVRERDETGKLVNVVKVTLEVARSKLARLGHVYLEYDRDTMDFIEVVPETGNNGAGKVLG